ncbi:hypothetical protein EPA93_46745 [Ktedonosporobacter rubrisoli]|uniref:Uncharacterized protein n=1 Tax=Ktedonosporobacter rubrisoli TaxID=2509675 RepID=A0A4P6K448_KTERU|nr:hypothetical protein [Ktedonosporobacter rubrisoli]QBD83068.1 hypothetical protein EPA93_46745 [Ktedonosporobacter rubrisoli]
MLSSDDISQTMQDLVAQETGALEQPATEPLESFPRQNSRQGALSERRHSLRQQRQTEELPKITSTAPTAGTRAAWKQVLHLREANRRLRDELETRKVEFEKELLAIHKGHQQEIEYYQQHLQEAMNESNRLREVHLELELRYQELYHSFEDAVSMETQKRLAQATQTPGTNAGETPALEQEASQNSGYQAKEEENKHLVEAMYLKREVQRMAELLESEQQQIEEERQHWLAMQATVREQAKLRYKTLHTRLGARWRARAAFIAIGVLALLVVLQLLFLDLLRIPWAGSIAIALLAPIVVCIVMALILVSPFSTLMQKYYAIMPHKKRVKQSA